MRQAQKSNRSRGRGNRKSGGGGGSNNINRVYDSAGPEGKVRGTPQQIIDKYLSLSRDAQTSGDRVAAENFLQHAEHYQRILIQAVGSQEQARRDAAAAATDSPADAAEQPEVEAPQETPVADPASAPQPVAEQPASEIGGMAMIDAGEPQPSLLVEAEEIAPPKPKRNGDGRSRRKKPAAAAPEAPAEAPAADVAAAAPAQTEAEG